MTRSSLIRSALAACLLLAPVTQLSAHSEDAASKPILVELFSSQSCGNCPDANETLIDIASDPNVFPIVWSVSYWEYLGVKEPYATPEVQARQRRYADRFDLRGPYTPQVVIDGSRQNSGNDESAIREKMALAEHEKTPKMALSFSDDSVMISSDELAGPSEVWLIGYIPGVTQLTPEAGRNSGKKLRHLNLATSLKKIGNWDGIEPERYDVACQDAACLVVVQESATGEILDFSLVPAVSG
ncbi:MAG: hypothetical protein CMK06_02585 [Ponticaulis sp.]|nr:hypothetical protein [Ponticaulis sp.]